MKFGGTSTKDADAMLNVTNIVRTYLNKNPIIVISAIAQATNLLEKIAHSAKEGDSKKAIAILEELIARHNKIISRGIKSSKNKTYLTQTINGYQTEISELINGVSILKELTSQTLDKFYSYGELMSSLIISKIMQENGIDAVWLDTKDFMITDNNFTRAQPLIHLIKEKLQPIIKKVISDKKIPITQGFIGVTTSGIRTTMGRESSDHSAAIIGAVLNVEDVQIWTDVDGVLTGDPNIVEKPQKIKRLTFEEAYQLSFFGAKVLHPNTMLPVQEKNIPIHVFNSKRPNLSGTFVSSANRFENKNSILKSITYKPSVVLIRVHPHQRYSPYIFWEHLFNIFNKYKITPLVCSTLEYALTVAIEKKSLNESILNEIETIGDFQLQDSLALITFVGQNLNYDTTLLHKVTKILQGINLYFASFGASMYSASIVVHELDMEKTVRLLHQKFFEKKLDNYFFEPIQ